MFNNDFDKDASIFENLSIDDSDDSLCPSIQMFSGLILSDKPFGYYFGRDEMVEFLKKLDYKVITKDNPEFPEIPIQIAVKKSEKVLPELDKSNIEEVFNKEVKSILLNWLLKLKQS